MFCLFSILNNDVFFLFFFFVVNVFVNIFFRYLLLSWLTTARAFLLVPTPKVYPSLSNRVCSLTHTPITVFRLLTTLFTITNNLLNITFKSHSLTYDGRPFSHRDAVFINFTCRSSSDAQQERPVDVCEKYYFTLAGLLDSDYPSNETKNDAVTLASPRGRCY